MKIILFLLFFVSKAFAVYTDKRPIWSPDGRQYDIVCFNENNTANEIYSDAVITKFKSGVIKFKENSLAPEKELKNKNCILEQKDTMSVARSEFMEALFRIKCDLNFVTFEKEDFRIIRKNNLIIVIKRLTDGKIWVLPAKKCKTEMSLPAIKTDSLPQVLPEPIVIKKTIDLQKEFLP